MTTLLVLPIRTRRMNTKRLQFVQLVAQILTSTNDVLYVIEKSNGTGSKAKVIDSGTSFNDMKKSFNRLSKTSKAGG